MGLRRAPLAVVASFAIATSFAACQTPTSMTVAVSTDVLCQELQQKSDAAIIVGHAAEDLLDLENVASTKTCEQEGAIGEVVLLPQGDEATEVAFKIVLGVGRPTSDCGLVDTGQPEGVWAGCIVARRRLAFLDGEALVVEVPLYERCIGVPCGDGDGGSPFTTCNSKGECVPADLDPEDCLTGCGEEQLQGTVTSAASTTGAGGDGGASSTSDATTTTTTSTGGGGGAGGGTPGCDEGDECLRDGGLAGVCDADGACVGCLDDTGCELTPSQAVCAVAECAQGTCGATLLDASTPCQGQPGVCDGAGTCVECVVSSDCPTFSDQCVGGFCQPASCSDGVKNDDETDLDCGGDDCAPCANGRPCGDAADPEQPENASCLSGFCAPPPAGQPPPVCAPCSSDGQCTAGLFCDATDGTCKEPLGDGDTCLGDSWCSSGICAQDANEASGVCCATVCEEDCRSCRGAETGEPSGVCAMVVTGTTCGEPFCPASNLAVELQCSAAGECSPVPTECGNGEVCQDGTCVDDGGTTSSTSTTGSGVGGGGGDGGATSTSTSTGIGGAGGGGDGGATSTSTSTGIGGAGGGGDGGAPTTSTTTGIGGADGVGGGVNPSSSAGQSLDCIEEADCDAIDPACACSFGTCLCPQLAGAGP